MMYNWKYVNKPSNFGSSCGESCRYLLPIKLYSLLLDKFKFLPKALSIDGYTEVYDELNYPTPNCNISFYSKEELYELSNKLKIWWIKKNKIQICMCLSLSYINYNICKKCNNINNYYLNHYNILRCINKYTNNICNINYDNFEKEIILYICLL